MNIRTITSTDPEEFEKLVNAAIGYEDDENVSIQFSTSQDTVGRYFQGREAPATVTRYNAFITFSNKDSISSNIDGI